VLVSAALALSSPTLRVLLTLFWEKIIFFFIFFRQTAKDAKDAKETQRFFKYNLTAKDAEDAKETQRFFKYNPTAKDVEDAKETQRFLKFNQTAPVSKCMALPPGLLRQFVGHRAGDRGLVGQAGKAVLLEGPFVFVVLAPENPVHLTGFGNITEFFGQLQQSQSLLCYLVLRGHFSLLWVVVCGKSILPEKAAARLPGGTPREVCFRTNLYQ